MEFSFATPKCALVPAAFFKAESAASELSQVVKISETEVVKHIEVPQYQAVLLYAAPNTISGSATDALPEMFYILEALGSLPEYNKILASYIDGYLFLAIAQGKSLLLANTYKALDFTTAQYFIFLAMKNLQLNPEVSTICWRTPIGPEEEMSLYRYFKSVERL